MAGTRAPRAGRVAALSALAALATGLAAMLVASRPGAPVPPPPAASTPAPAPPASVPVAWPTPFSVPVHALPPPVALPPGTIRILVVGDSVAKFLGLALRYRQDEARAFVAERGVGSCSIFEAKERIEDGKRVMGTSCSTTWPEDVAELRPDITLVVQGGAFLNERACEPAWLASYEERVLGLTRAMGQNAGRVVLALVPYPMDRWRHGTVLDRVDCFDEMLRKTAEKAHLGVVDLKEYVCPTRACNIESRGHPIRPDGLHFDGVGAEETARWTLRELRRIAAPR
jgi:hypothetical protein